MPSRTERLEARLEELEQRIALMEKIQAEGIDHLIVEIQRLSDNDGVLGEVAEEQDNTIAAIRSLLVDAKVTTDEAIDGRKGEIVRLREQAKKKRQEQAELQEMSFRAEQAAKEEAGHPKEAFIFGG